MPVPCAVPGCREDGTLSFPGDPALNMQWRVAINRMDPEKNLWQPTPNSKVCGNHFKPQDFKATGKKRRILKKGAVPSIFPPDDPAESAASRAERAAKRQKVCFAEGDVPRDSNEQASVSREVEIGGEELIDGDIVGREIVGSEIEIGGEVEIGGEIEIGGENEIGEEIEISGVGTDDNNEIVGAPTIGEKQKPNVQKICPFCNNKFKAIRSFTFHLIDDHDVSEADAEQHFEKASLVGNPSMSTQTASSGEISFSLERFKDDPEAMRYYTSFDDYKHFMYVFRCLGQAAYHLDYKSQKLDPPNEFFLFMVKLRQAKDDYDLGKTFGVSRKVAAQIFFVWLHFVYHRLQEEDLFLDKDVIEATMPMDFKEKFGTTRIILDATEVKMTKPGKLSEQRSTWSSYKNANTAKVMVGISPKGVVTHISPAFGGATSDRQIIERSELLEDGKFESGDSIMADRGT